jgi:uncharacterized protein YggU (UPF0235/DUF167 family)
MGTVFSVRAHADARKFALRLEATSPPIVVSAWIPAKPESGLANGRLVFELEKLLSCQVSILAGHKSRKKTLSAECDLETLLLKFREFEKECKK